jgi:hypothetical protein
MFQKRFSSGLRARRRNRRNLCLTAALVAISLSPVALFVDLGSPGDAPPAATSASIAGRSPAQDAVAVASLGAIDATLVDPRPALKPEAPGFARNAPLETAFRLPPLRREAGIGPLAPSMPQESTQESMQEPMQQPAQESSRPPAQPPQQSAALNTAGFLPAAPLPAPRPAQSRASRPSENPRVASAPAAASMARSAAPAGAPPDNRSFIEKLFGVKPASPPESALGYASLDSTGSIAPNARFNPAPGAAPGAGTAVYDITARVVTLPNGERLEAHSGLGDKLDDPRFVHLRMRGATPPGTYELTERERLFHGVRAIRLNPVGGSAAIYGRDGILAHTYLLGPNGDSNGCVSIKNYDRFLQAYLRGEVKRLVVVTGRGQDVLPRIVNRRSGRAT